MIPKQRIVFDAYGFRVLKIFLGLSLFYLAEVIPSYEMRLLLLLESLAFNII